MPNLQAPWVGNPPECDMPKCPCCDDDTNVFYKSLITNEIVGCPECVSTFSQSDIITRYGHLAKCPVCGKAYDLECEAVDFFQQGFNGEVIGCGECITEVDSDADY